MTAPDFDEVERTLADARRRLDALRAGRGGAAQPVREQDAGRPGGRRDEHGGDDDRRTRGSGVAADGRVRAVAADGLIESVELDPRVLRLSTEELARHVLAALNAALDDLRVRALPGDGSTRIDPGMLAARLGEVQEQAMHQLYRLTSALQDVVGEIRRDADVTGAVEVPDFGRLFDETRRMLDSLGAGSPPGRHGQAVREDVRDDGRSSRGEGRAGPGGMVCAAAGPDGRVGSLSIEAAVVRRGSHEVAAHVVTAVNAALDEAYRQRREHADAAAVDRADLATRVRMVQDLSVSQMRAFGQSLADLMASISPRA